MTDLEKIILSALGAILVYVLGQILSKLFIEPVYELRKTIGRVRFNLAYHAPTLLTPVGRTKESSDRAWEALMTNSAELIAGLHAIPLYRATRAIACGVLPDQKAIERAAVQLRGLSTYVHEDGSKANEALDIIRKRIEKVEKLLGLDPLE